MIHLAIPAVLLLAGVRYAVTDRRRRRREDASSAARPATLSGHLERPGQSWSPAGTKERPAAATADRSDS